MIREKKSVYLTKKTIDNIQDFADNTGHTWNGALINILNDYFDRERDEIIEFMKGGK